MTHVTDAPAPRVSLNETAYRRLREDIIACRLAPGQRLTEKQLAADLGFSIAPLRDALTRLDHEGLIRTVPRKGYQVTPLTPKSIDDLFTLWQIVGPELIPARHPPRDRGADRGRGGDLRGAGPPRRRRRCPVGRS